MSKGQENDNLRCIKCNSIMEDYDRDFWGTCFSCWVDDSELEGEYTLDSEVDHEP